MSPSLVVIAGLAPSARSTSRSSALAAQLPADHLTDDEQRGERDDPPEHAEGDRLRLDRPLGLRLHDRGDRVRRDRARARRPVDLGFDRGTSRLPRSSWMPTPDTGTQHDSNGLVNAGVNCAPPDKPASTSSTTTSPLPLARPTSLALTRR